MFNLFKKFVDFNKREVDVLAKKVLEINELEDKARKLKDEDFAKETRKLKDKVQSGEQSLDDIAPWAFALVREASRRVLGERHYDVQLMAGLALHQGKVAEQKTGEGKTLSATAPLYLNALSGMGAHLVTVNDYLARRDTGWMGGVYHFLGLSVSAIISDQSFIYDVSFRDEQTTDWRLRHLKASTRSEAYAADITYGINSEFGFDYLRDNMSYGNNDLVQRGFHFAIIDEVDSVLIDEARTPHIISAPYDEDTSKYYQYAQVVKKLVEETDYKVDEKSKTAHLTDEGIRNVETMLDVTNIYEKDFDTLFHIEASLKAQALFKKDKDYIVKDDEVVIVDEFTGRLLQGRRFSEGLHQAIEAKEGVAIKRESRTLATVSLQNYFRMYEKLAGMTGTAATEAEEFSKIYKLDVIILPTHKDNVRKDHSDMIYKTERAKFNAVAAEIAEHHKTGRPVLVGTTSIQKNELLSHLLKKMQVPHQLLNAKNHEGEANIIANAGQKGAVTVATNMAGRGVDIVLGGEAPNKYEIENTKKAQEEFAKKDLAWRKRHDEVVSLGGLYVVGTERHESRRIDNQLRGRAGRQGDPGDTRFFVSLEDDLMRIFGGEQVSRLMTFFNLPEEQPLEHSMVSRALEQAQVKVEGFNFDIRKHLVEFDDVLNKQREIVYSRRRAILLGEEKGKQSNYYETIFEVFTEEVIQLVNMYFSQEGPPDREKLAEEVVQILPLSKDLIMKNLEGKDAQQAQEYLVEAVEKQFQKREKEVGVDLWKDVVRHVFLTTIDKFWTEHLTAIDDLREGINLRGYAQLDPLIEYKNEAFTMFEKLLSDIDFEITRRLFKLEVVQDENKHIHLHSTPEPKMQYQSASKVDPYKQREEKVEVAPQQIPISPVEESHIVEASASEETSQEPYNAGGFKIIPPGTSQKRPGRNDPCWCGSGKKYKKCHYPN